MIVEWFWSLVAGFSQWFTGLFPPWDVPAWLHTVDDTVNTLTNGLGGLGAWIDWNVFIVVVTTSLATWVVCALIKLARVVAAHFPFVGGSG